MADGSLEMELFYMEETANMVADLIKPAYVNSGLHDTFINSGVFTLQQRTVLTNYVHLLAASYLEERDDQNNNSHHREVYDHVRKKFRDQTITGLIAGMSDISREEKLELLALRD